MIVSNVKVPVRYSEKELFRAIQKAAGKKNLKVNSVQILKRSIDARKKPALFYVMKLAVNEKKIKARPFIRRVDTEKTAVVIGAGPCGLFAAMTLQYAGVKTVLLERGKPVDERTEDVEKFWQTGILNPESNVQFGEGGAGTFSDGKLNTMTEDKNGLNARVLTAFYEAGAKEEILYDAKPHIGTDELKKIVKTFRENFISMGGEVKFNAKVTGLQIKTEDESRIVEGVTFLENGKEQTICCDYTVLAVGHSARDLFYTLRNLEVPMEQKPFAVGVRMEHAQEMITMQQYGSLDYEELQAAPYKVTAKTSGGRGVYSFCMCPGGYVVNASSEERRLCINGMSYSARDSKNANAGIVIQVTPDDFPSDDVLSGVEFQRVLEEKAFNACNGKIPVQRYGDFIRNRKSDHFGSVTPVMKGAYDFGEIREVLPPYLTDALFEAIPKFSKMIPGFDTEDALLSAVEARTSSPVRIIRNEKGESKVKRLFPAGEGAGYAGGITSAAMDGIRVSEWILDDILGETNG